MLIPRVMVKFTVLISIVILIAGLFLVFNKLFTPQPIQITLQSGQEITTTTPEYFSLAEVLLLLVSTFLIGTASTYLFYNSDDLRAIRQPKQKLESTAIYESIVPLLKPDEKQVITALLENKGEIQQNKLVIKLNISKVKATRVLYALEQKKLIIKHRHGLTNMIRLDKKFYEQ